MNDFDSPWKEATTRHFPDFLGFFFPAVAARIDWTRGYQMLDTELQALGLESPGPRRVDCLVRVSLLDGREQWILIHIEVQSQYDEDFGQRMLVYNVRILAKHGRPCCSLAILADPGKGWRPNSGELDTLGCRLRLDFLVQKLRDYPETVRWPTNPFSWLVAAHRQAQKTRTNPQKRRQIKFALTRGLYRTGLQKEQILEFFALVDAILALPKELEYAFRDDLQKWEDDQKMRYVTSIERLAREEGLSEGLQKGLSEGLQKGRSQGLEEGTAGGRLEIAREMLLDLLQTRWGPPPPGLTRAVMEQTEVSVLRDWMRRAAVSDSLKEWSQVLGTTLTG